MSEKIKIEKGIKGPATRMAGKYPFKDMEIGDSFLVPFESEMTIRTRAYHFGGTNPGFKFTVRKVQNGIRCWRIPVKE